MIDYLSLISKYTAGEHPQTVPALIIHSALVTKKALEIARDYSERSGEVVDLRFIEEAGMLHDLGIFSTATPFLFTNGAGDYLTHISQGQKLLDNEGLSRHAHAIKTHSAIRKEAILDNNLPLPPEDHMPQTVEEEILFLADKFYRKNFKSLFREFSLEEIKADLEKYGAAAVQDFDRISKKYLN